MLTVAKGTLSFSVCSAHRSGDDRADREVHREEAREEHQLAGEPHDGAHRHHVGPGRRPVTGTVRDVRSSRELPMRSPRRPLLPYSRHGARSDPRAGWRQASGAPPALAASATIDAAIAPTSSAPRPSDTASSPPPTRRARRRHAASRSCSTATTARTRDAVRLAVGRRPATDVEVSLGASAPPPAAVIAAVDAGALRPPDPGRRGRPGRRAGPVPPAQERDLRLPARSSCSPGARRTAGWPPGRRPTSPCRTRSTRSPLADGGRRAGSRRGLGRPEQPALARPAAEPDLAGPAHRAASPARTSTARPGRVGHGPDHGRRGQPGPGRRLPGRRCGPRARRVDEMRGLADAMLAHAIRIEVPGPSLDIVGTGGDRAHTVNISTMASIVVAGAGRARGQARQPGRVLLLGVGGRARGARGRPGPAARAGGRASPREAGITFCFAQTFHPSFRHAAGRAPRPGHRRRRSTSSAR